MVNGAEVLSEAGKRETTSGISENMYIGMGKSAGQNNYFSGKIAEVLVYDRALSAEESEKVHNYLLKKYELRQETGENEEPKNLEECVALDLEDRQVGEVTQDDTQLGIFKYGGASVENEDGNKVLRVRAVDGESRHYGFYLKDVEYSEAVVEMDMKYNNDNNFTHDWESVSIQGFASTKGGEAQLSQKRKLVCRKLPG